MGRNAKYRLTLREKALAKLGGKCKHCGNKDPRVLEFDHITPGRGRRSPRNSGRTHLEVLRGKGGIQILCANCHAIKTYEEVHNGTGTR